MTVHSRVLPLVSLLVACGGGLSVGHGDASSGPGADAVDSPSPDATMDDSRPTSTIVGDCTTDADCVLVLDYRAGFECWWPVGASLADVSRDHCLLPWTRAPGPIWCAAGTPPSDCPGGDIPVMHSCLATSCLVPACNGGKCGSRFDLNADQSQCGATPSQAPVDCGSLRATYFNLLAAAQACDPSKEQTTCVSSYRDGCGCPAAADSTSPQATALICAQAAIDEGNCGYGNCGSPCPTGNRNAVCVPNGTGTMGTCTMQ